MVTQYNDDPKREYALLYKAIEICQGDLIRVAMFLGSNWTEADVRSKIESNDTLLELTRINKDWKTSTYSSCVTNEINCIPKDLIKFQQDFDQRSVPKSVDCSNFGCWQWWRKFNGS